MDGGFIEIKLDSPKKQVKPKYTEYEIESAAETIVKAHKIQQDSELMPYVKDYMNKHKMAVNAAEKSTKKIKPKSLADLKKMEQEYNAKENSFGLAELD